jgi:hypothetical protein
MTCDHFVHHALKAKLVGVADENGEGGALVALDDRGWFDRDFRCRLYSNSTPLRERRFQFAASDVAAQVGG